MVVVDTEELHVILDRAGVQLTTLAAREQEIEQQICETQHAIATMELAKEKAFQALTQKRETLADLEREHEQAVQYGKLAQGTPGEQGAVTRVRQLKRQIETSRREIARDEKQFTSETETRREQELRDILARLHVEREGLQQEAGQTRGARDQARDKLGALKLQSHLDRLAEHDGQIDALKSQLLAAQVAHQETIDQALTDLQDWSEHLAAVKALRPIPEDSAYRIARAALFYVEAVCAETVETPNKPMRDLPAVSEEWKRKAYENLIMLPGMEWLRSRSGGNWRDLGPCNAERLRSSLTDFLMAYGEHLNLITGG